MRIAYCLTHPIQYQSPMIRYLVDQGIDLHVIYATDITAGQYQDAGFGSAVKWDLPLLDGYEYSVLKPASQIPTGFRCLKEFRSLIADRIGHLKADVVWAHGWGNGYALGAILAGRSLQKKILLRGETHLGSLRGSGNGVRRFLHRQFVKCVLKRVDALLAVGTANKQFYLHHGVSADKIFTTPYVVDNHRFQTLAEQSAASSHSIRDDLQIRTQQPIVLYCAKLIDVKDPATLIEAVGRVRGCDPVLLVVGEGKLRPEMEQLADEVAHGRVRFLGFKNQSELPAYYAVCDVFVLPSMFEPWGLVINEVMNAGKPVVAANCVGAAHDLIQAGENGDLFSPGSVEELALILESWLYDRDRCLDAGILSLKRINQWGFPQVLDGLSMALNSLRSK